MYVFCLIGKNIHSFFSELFFQTNFSILMKISSEDLLETAINIQNNPSFSDSNYISPEILPNIGLFKMCVKVPSLSELIDRYAELNMSITHMGLDETYTSWGNRLCCARQEEGEEIVRTGSPVDARRHLRRGAVPALRAKLWRLSLALPGDVSEIETIEYESLRRSCDTVDLITDELYIMDVLNIADDTRYFIFEDELREIMLLFSRDEYVRQNAQYELHRPMRGPGMTSEEQEKNNRDSSAPPCGIQPFLGLATYFAPLCYICRKGPALYSLARNIFCRYICSY